MRGFRFLQQCVEDSHIIDFSVVGEAKQFSNFRRP